MDMLPQRPHFGQTWLLSPRQSINRGETVEMGSWTCRGRGRQAKSGSNRRHPANQNCDVTSGALTRSPLDKHGSKAVPVTIVGGLIAPRGLASLRQYGVLWRVGLEPKQLMDAFFTQLHSAILCLGLQSQSGWPALCCRSPCRIITMGYGGGCTSTVGTYSS